VEPRPTRRYEFNWKPYVKTLCISVVEGVGQEAEWVGLSKVRGPNVKQYLAKPKPITTNPLYPTTLLDQVETQVESTSIQAQYFDSIGISVVEKPLVESLVDEASGSLFELVEESRSSVVFDLVVLELFSSGPTHEVTLLALPHRDHFSDSGPVSQDLQLALMDSTICEEPLSLFSCTPLHTLVPSAQSPLLMISRS
jgi:hypothetical protein